MTIPAPRIPKPCIEHTTLAEYRKAEPAWETVLDLDALATAEKENWVWSGATCLGPDYRRCLNEDCHLAPIAEGMHLTLMIAGALTLALALASHWLH